MGNNEIMNDQLLDVLKTTPTKWGEIGYITFKRTYARRLKEDDKNSKTEEFWHVIKREIEASDKQLNVGFTDAEKIRYAKTRLELKWSVAGRFMWQLGTKTVDKLGLPSLQNCAAIVVDSPIRPFTWAMEMLMLGSGVGYNIQREYVYQLPKLKKKIKIERHDNEDADYVVPDTREGWVKLLGKVLKAHFYAGEGFTFSTQLIRGKGAPIKGFGGTASGPEELCWGINEINKILNNRSNQKLRPIDCLDIMNIIGYIVVAGNVRRSAQLALGDYDDVEYLKAKRWDLKAIPNWRSMSNNSIVAPDNLEDLLQEFWDTYQQGEPYGLINLKLSRQIGRTGETEYPDKDVMCYNPCITGDTLVAVADGRNAVPIKDLVGSQYPVYSIKNGKTVIKKSIKTWKTRENAEIWKLTLDDGSFIRATPDHLIMLRNGEYKPLKDLIKGESLMPFNSYKSGRYRQISSNKINCEQGKGRRQYRMMAEYYGLYVEPKTTAIHHKDFNSLNDCIENLQPLPHAEHNAIHSLRMMGENNPVNKMSKERYKEVYKNFINGSGEQNRMFGKKHKESTLELIGKKSHENWINQPELMSMKIKEGMNNPETRKKISDARTKEKFLWKCKVCEKELFLTSNQIQNKVTCSISCSNKNRYNHKVESIEFIGYEDVYDMTVEETHNFGVITSTKDNKFIESSGIFIHNCAEQSLASAETCCLAEIYLPNIDNYEELKEVISYAYRINKHSLALPCSLKETEAIVNANMRMGIGMTGVLQASKTQRSWLDKAYKWLREYDKKYSAEKGFPESIKLTTVKPSGCCIPSTKIKTNKGLLSFEEIFQLNNINLNEKISEYRTWYNMNTDIKVLDKNGDYKQINKLFVNGYESTIKLTFEDGFEIECTPNHKFLLKSGEWKQAIDLNENDELEDKFLKVYSLGVRMENK